MKIIVWSKSNCPQCDQAKNLLKQSSLTFEENKIGENYTVDQLLSVAPGVKSVPQIFVDDKLIGGMKELQEYLKNAGYTSAA